MTFGGRQGVLAPCQEQKEVLYGGRPVRPRTRAIALLRLLNNSQYCVPEAFWVVSELKAALEQL
jgi:hypothetical protein